MPQTTDAGLARGVSYTTFVITLVGFIVAMVAQVVAADRRVSTLEYKTASVEKSIASIDTKLNQNSQDHSCISNNLIQVGMLITLLCEKNNIPVKTFRWTQPFTEAYQEGVR